MYCADVFLIYDSNTKPVSMPVTTLQTVKLNAEPTETITLTKVEKRIDEPVLAEPKLLETEDVFTVAPKPVDRLAEAGKTLAWTAPVGALAGWLAQTNLHLLPAGEQFTKALGFLKDRLPEQAPVSETLAKFGLHLDKLKNQAGLSGDQLQHLKDVVAKTPIADIMQHPEKILQQAHISDHALAAGLGGALFTGAIGLGMSQLFANDKKTANQKIAEFETNIAKDQAKKDLEKQIGELKKQKELKEKQTEISELETELALEAGK